MTQQMSEFDVFYISYDEPNCEKHWAQLLDIAPWAKRVHGVKGFDAAHKECARQSETAKFITVDGDNIIDPEFLNLEVDIPAQYDDCVLSWASTNAINGLVYGNGGLKLWPKEQTLLMNTHENATEQRFQLDFCWDKKYIQMNNVYSTTHPNGSPFQAFRAGFREGVKMTVDAGHKIDIGKIKDQVHIKNLKRLMIWMSVGADVIYGYWAMLGARMGLIKSNLDPSFDVTIIRDYDLFRKYFDDHFGEMQYEDMYESVAATGHKIKQATGLDVAALLPDQSKFFKFVYEPPKRVAVLRTEIEVDTEGR